MVRLAASIQVGVTGGTVAPFCIWRGRDEAEFATIQRSLQAAKAQQEAHNRKKATGSCRASQQIATRRERHLQPSYLNDYQHKKAVLKKESAFFSVRIGIHSKGDAS